MKYALSFLIHAFPDAVWAFTQVGDEPDMPSLAYWARHAEAGQAQPSSHGPFSELILSGQGGEEVPVVEAALSLIFF